MSIEAEINQRQYWQIACGSDQREYWDDFLRYGLAFVGGDEQCKTMTQKVKAGERMLMKSGKSIGAVGEIVCRDGIVCGDACDSEFASAKGWLRDYDGWDLPAFCNVDWKVHPDSKVDPNWGTESELEWEKVSSLGRRTIERINSAKVIEKFESLFENWQPVSKPANEPEPTKQVVDEEIKAFLVSRGTSEKNAFEFIERLKNILSIAQYYYRQTDWGAIPLIFQTDE